MDYNYNVELCLSSDTMIKVNEPMLILELFLRGSDGKELERVIIEMNKVEAKAFVSKLREIEKVSHGLFSTFVILGNKRKLWATSCLIRETINTV